MNLGSDTFKLSGFSSFPLHTGSCITPVIQCGQNAKEKSNNWKRLLIAGIFRNFFLRCHAMSNVFQPLGQVHMHGAYSGPCIAGLVLQEVKFGHWAKTVISFRLSWLAILLASVHASSSQANQRSRSIEPTRYEASRHGPNNLRNNLSVSIPNLR